MALGQFIEKMMGKRVWRWLAVAAIGLTSGFAQAAEYDLVLNHTDSPDPVVAGANVTYTLRVTNDGYANAVTNIQLNDTLPVAGSPSASYKVGTYVSATPSPSGASCNVAAAVVTCDLGTLAPQAEATVVVVVRSSTQGIMRNLAAVTSTTPGFVDPNAGNSSNFQDTTVKQGADVNLRTVGPNSLTSSVANPQAGQSLSYSLQVFNNGPDNASSVQAIVRVPSAAFTVTSLPSGCGQTTAAGTTAIACDISGTLGLVGGTTLSGIIGVVTASTPSTLTATAEVLISSLSAPQDPDTTNNTTSLDLTVGNGSDVTIAKTQSLSNPITTGTTFYYTLTPRYTGDVPSGVRVTDSVPVGITVTGVTPSDGNWNCAASAGQTVDCTRNTTGLAAGYNQGLGSIQVNVTAATAGGYTNTANVSSTSPTDPVPGNNSASVGTTIVPAEANLHANKAAYRSDGTTLLTPALVVTTQPFKWRLSITNDGPSPFAGQLTLTDTLPANVQVNAYINETSGYWTCTPDTVPLPVAGAATITCNSAAGVTLGVGATSPYLDLNVEATATAALSNQACSTNSTPTGAADLTADNCRTSSVNSDTNPNSADIEIIKTDSPDPVTAGDVLTYTLKIVNHSATTANDVRVRDTIGNLINSTVHATTGGVLAVPSITTVGVSTGGACAASAGNGSKAYDLACDFTTLPFCDDTAGNVCPIITIQVRPNGTTPRSNTATAYSYQTPDGTLSNNTSTVSTTVNQRTDVRVSLNSTPASVRVGENVRYTANAENWGVSAADNATVTVTLPEGMVFLSATPSAGAGCSTVPGVSGTLTDATHKTVICNLGTLALPEPAATTTQNVQILVRPTLNTGSGAFSRTITTNASVTTTTPETDATNNSASVSTTVTQPQQDLQIQIDDLQDPVAVGYNVTYRLTATNNGPSYASNVRVSHTLPSSNVAFVSAGTGGCVGGTVGAAGGTVICSLGGLASGATATVDVVLKGTAIAVVNNTVSVTSDELDAGTNYDPLTGNNSDMEDTTFKQPSDLSLTKTANRTKAKIADTVKFTVTVRNDGPANATDVTVKDYLPAQFAHVSNDGGATHSAGVVTWVAGNLNVGQSKTLIITTTVNAGTADGAYVNHAQITASSQPDQDSTPNNCATSNCGGAAHEDDDAQATVTVDSTATQGNISGKVYLDANDNGLFDLGETGIAGVALTLIPAAGSSVTVTTDNNGNYQFTGVESGQSFTIRETHPVAYLDGKETVGAPANGWVSASNAAGTAANAGYDATAGNNQITGIDLAANDDATGYNFGERSYGSGGLATVSGHAWYNTRTTDKRQEAGEPNASLFVVELARNGAAVASATTDASGAYRFTNVTPGDGYEIRFLAPHVNPSSTSGERPIYGEPISQDPVYNASTPDYTRRTIANLVLRAGVELTEQNLPIDPSGIIYDAVTRIPVANATVSILGPAGFIPAVHLVGGLANVNQVTDSSGFYQFLLYPTAPAGDYSLQVTHASYVATPSLLIPPCTGALAVGALPNPALIQANPYAPLIGTTDHRAQPGACAANSSGLTPLNQATTQYYFTFTLSGASGNVLNNHIPLDPAPLGAGPLIVLKSTPLINVTRGDLVPYTVTAININAVVQTALVVRDVVPPGFKYKVGSATVDGVHLEPAVNGRELAWTGQNFAAVNTAGSRHVYRLILVVGSGVGEGEYINAARATTAAGASVSNTATATVRVVPDPTFDCSDIIGKVFDDQNANGYQDQGEPGIANVRVATARGLLVTTDKDGRFHVACAVIPQAQRGSNFFMKLDERSLPSGYRLTTENPREVRATRGKLVKLNFGAAIHRVVRLELTDAAFQAGKSDPVAALASALDKLPESLRVKPSVVRLAYQAGADEGDLAKQRLRAVRERLEQLWKAQGCCYTLVFEEEIFERAATKKGSAK